VLFTKSQKVAMPRKAALGRPGLDWTLLARGMGVPGTWVTSLDAFGKALRKGLESEGPTLIDVLL
jgi:thiamine pyrophosphate-dependent acetolactate synthase large subunit-like protein